MQAFANLIALARYLSQGEEPALDQLALHSRSDADNLVSDLLSTLKLDVKPAAVSFWSPPDAAPAAQGRQNTGSVVVHCVAMQDKISVYKSLKQLKGTKFHYLHVDEDLTKRQVAARKEQQASFLRLKEEGKRPYWHGTQLMVAGKPYTENKRPPPPPPCTTVSSPALPGTSFSILAPEASA